MLAVETPKERAKWQYSDSIGTFTGQVLETSHHSCLDPPLNDCPCPQFEPFTPFK